MGSIAPYASVYLEGRGLSDAEIGLVMSLGGLTVLLMPAMMSLLADLKLEHRVLLRSLFIGTATALGLMLLSRSFWWLLPAFWLWSMAISPMMSMNDGLLFSIRGVREASGKTTPPYHHIRVFGTLGFIAPSFVLYVLMAYYQAPVSVALACGIAVSVIAMGNTFLLPRTHGSMGKPTPPAEVPDPHPPASKGKGLPTLLALRCMLQPDLALFCAAMWLTQASTAAYYTFYPLYLTRVIGVQDQWLGLISAVGVVFEIGYVLAFGWLLKKLGVRWLLILGVGAVGLRLMLLWAFPTLTVAVGSQLLHGLTVLAIFILPPLYLNHRAEPRFLNSIQGLYAMIVFGTGRIFGNVFAGQIAEIFDGDILMVFAWTAGFAGAAMLLCVLFFRDRSGSPITL
jgi:MFS transporter, PPP family, 3-phenylpropionic acid transporter